MLFRSDDVDLSLSLTKRALEEILTVGCIKFVLGVVCTAWYVEIKG